MKAGETEAKGEGRTVNLVIVDRPAGETKERGFGDLVPCMQASSSMKLVPG